MGVMIPFILGTEFMMPFADQKWLLPASRMVSKSGLGCFGTFLAGTRPGALRPGTVIAFAAAGTAVRSVARATRRVMASWRSPADMAGEAAARVADAGADAGAAVKADVSARAAATRVKRSILKKKLICEARSNNL